MAQTPVGVLQVLDKRGSPSFSLRDMELLAVFARQATAAIEASKVQRDSTRLLRSVLGAVGDGELAEDQVDELLAAATVGWTATTTRRSGGSWTCSRGCAT